MSIAIKAVNGRCPCQRCQGTARFYAKTPTTPRTVTPEVKRPTLIARIARKLTLVRRRSNVT